MSVVRPGQFWLHVKIFRDLFSVSCGRSDAFGRSRGQISILRSPQLMMLVNQKDVDITTMSAVRRGHNFSYVWTGEYEIFEWNLGSTFNYAEMAALICPRPFMVERGHFDGVGLDEYVAFEYAKVRFLYAAQLKIPERTEIEWFDGPHTINGQATYKFLHKHLNWPEPPQ